MYTRPETNLEGIDLSSTIEYNLFNSTHQAFTMIISTVCSGSSVRNTSLDNAIVLPKDKKFSLFKCKSQKIRITQYASE